MKKTTQFLPLMFLLLSACAEEEVDWSDPQLRYGDDNCIEGGLVGGAMEPDC